ncbi:MAG: AraC family transcriptional regulator [Clostridia bacterium]|nr:AraC family transcriptional regulator [Clostridia bacterium]
MNTEFTALLEHRDYKDSRPWAAAKQTFETAHIAPPHFAESIEILLCRDAVGEAYIGGRKFEVGGKKVLYIPSLTVHSFDYTPCNGVVWVIKIHPTLIKKFIDLKEILGEYERSPELLLYEYDCYDELIGRVHTLFEEGDFSEALQTILEMFRIFAVRSPKTTAAELVNRTAAASKVNEIITWTEENYGTSITLDDISHRFGYNKSYFCEMFKAATGETYLKYLNNVRISAACAMLKAGTPVKETGRLCGYETDSYFIALFKRVLGITPKQYQLGK